MATAGLPLVDIIATYIEKYQLDHALVGDKKINVLLDNIFVAAAGVDVATIQKFNSKPMIKLRNDLSQCCGIDTQRSKKGYEIHGNGNIFKPSMKQANMMLIPLQNPRI
jgi:hypothetical protein